MIYNYNTISKLSEKKDLTILWSELQRYCPNTTSSSDIIINWIHEATIKRLIFSDCVVELEYASWIVKSIDIIKDWV